jgi:multidrug efflux pump subunit AcrA (membrane-fusion protein)
LGASVNGDLEDRVKQLRLDDQLGTGKVRRGGSWLPWVLCGLLAVTWAGVGARWYKASGQRDDGPTNSTASPSAPAPSGGAGPVTPPGTVVTTLKGIVTPSLQVTVSPRDVAAEITDIFFAEGKRVRKNDKLATLLDHQYANQLKMQEAAVKSSEAQWKRAEAAEISAKAKVAKALAALASAKAKVTRAIAQQDRARKDFEQAKRQDASGTISAQDYQMFEANKLTSDADKVAADADVVAAEKEIEAARADENTATASLAAARADFNAA